MRYLLIPSAIVSFFCISLQGLLTDLGPNGVLQLPIESYFQPCLDKPPQFCQQIEGIDYIYLINLDKRPERLKRSLEQLAPYGIIPYRFPAIYWGDLSFEALRGVAVSYKKGMREDQWAVTVGNKGGLEYVFLEESMVGRPVMSQWMTPGHVGCALSLCSILQDAYDSGYETIWVLEDDIDVQQDPHLIAQLVKKLDLLTQGDWDVLYTDSREEVKESLPSNACWWMWRPDQELYDTSSFPQREKVTDDFIKVGSRSRTHSIIIRRAGLKKFLTHIKAHYLYLPIDHEIAFSFGMKLYMMSETLVTYTDSPSDTQPVSGAFPVQCGSSSRDSWEVYKSQQLAKLPEFSGWCSQQRGNHLMDFVCQQRPEVCVEIGTFGGATTFPLIMALKYQNRGHLFTIDAWDTEEAVKGLNPTDPNRDWWGEHNLEATLHKFLFLLAKMRLKPWCTVLQMSSQRAVSQFADESIDLLYLDGNFSSLGSLDDVIQYFPKVKRGGYIWINDASLPAKLSSVTYLMQHAVWLKEKSIGNQCVVFKK